MDLRDCLAQKRVLVCVGSGGVGKTTTAAALALQAASLGRRTLVLTIDPAKRLANSLGLEELGHDVQQVPADRVAAAAGSSAVEGQGELHAMMLDQKRAFDEVVARHTTDPEAIKRILENSVYRQISGSLAGAQEYAALATLQEFNRQGQYELIVVDTPPTAHALDFLDAPEKLTHAIDSPAIEWFRRLRDRDSGGWSVVGRTGAYVLKRLSKFVGSQFLDDLAVFFTEFNDILGGFRARAEETFALLREPGVGFILVASPEAMAVREALFFHERLAASGMALAGFVMNRIHRDLPVDADATEIASALSAEPAVQALGLQPVSLRMASEALLSSHQALQRLAAADRDSIAKVRTTLEAGVPLVGVPHFDRDVHDLTELARVGDHLSGRETVPL